MPILIAGGGTPGSQGERGLNGSSSIITNVSRTLNAVDWVASGDYWIQSVSIPEVTATSLQEVYQENPDKAQALAFAAAVIQGRAQAAGTFSVACYGVKPSINLPIKVQVSVADRLGGTGDTELIEADIAGLKASRANKSTVITGKSLLAASWSGTSAPYTLSLDVAGVLPNDQTKQEIYLPTSANAAQFAAYAAAQLADGGQTTGNITIKAFGDKPTIDIPVVIEVTVR